jgi:hypothetical protein
MSKIAALVLFLGCLLQLNGLVVPPGGPFHAEYQYYRAQGCVREADNYQQNFQLESALCMYSEARVLLDCSRVVDKQLDFHIEVGTLVSELFVEHTSHHFEKRINNIFYKFVSNPPPVKMMFEQQGRPYDHQPLCEAQ